jgi:uncharacterized metal-binding protein YceD (DUF177 family)
MQLEREYELGDLPRLKDILASPCGTLSAHFAFAILASGRPGAEVSIEATPELVCQRCMQSRGLAVTSASEVEFATSDEADAADSDRELYRMKNGQVSLRDLAEEELLLALPHVFMCETPETCGRAPSYAIGDDTAGGTGDMRRPFSALQDLLKKT